MATILFFDDYACMALTNLERVMGVPAWRPEGTLDDELSDGTWNYPSVFYDSEAGLWRLLYSGVVHTEPGSDPPELEFLGLLCAESADGIHWRKPDLAESVHIENRRRANQVLTSKKFDGGPAYFDARESDPEKRLKILYNAGRELGMPYATSRNGLHWSVQPSPWSRQHLDMPVCIFYNDHRGNYVVTHRAGPGDRRVAFKETANFEGYSDPQIVMTPDSDDAPLSQFYGMPVFPYEGMYVGLLWILHTEPTDTGRWKRGGYVDCCLAYSYDGWHFNRALHRPFISRTPLGEPGSGGIYPSTMLVDDGGEVRFYSGGSRAGHFHLNDAVDSAVLMHTMRMDGFFYVQPSGIQGRLLTRCMRFRTPDLRLNVSCSYGRVRCRLTDTEGEPVPGFTFNESEPFTGDELYFRPHWRGGHTLAKVLGQIVHLEIELTNARLYAIRGDMEVLYSSSPAR